MNRSLLIAAAVAAILSLPALATAVVPPQSCGTMRVEGKRYQVKKDQMSCNTARGHVKRFLTTGRKPRGYKCKNYPSKKGRVDFYCNNAKKIFFAIRR